MSLRTPFRTIPLLPDCYGRLNNVFSLVDLGALIMRKVFQQNHTSGPYFVVGVISSLMIGSDSKTDKLKGHLWFLVEKFSMKSEKRSFQ